MESFFNIKNLMSRKKVMESFFDIKNLKSRKKVIQLFFCKKLIKSFLNVKNKEVKKESELTKVRESEVVFF